MENHYYFQKPLTIYELCNILQDAANVSDSDLLLLSKGQIVNPAEDGLERKFVEEGEFRHSSCNLPASFKLVRNSSDYQGIDFLETDNSKIKIFVKLLLNSIDFSYGKIVDGN